MNTFFDLMNRLQSGCGVRRRGGGQRRGAQRSARPTWWLVMICGAVLMQVHRVQAGAPPGETLAGYAGNGSADGIGSSALFFGPQAVTTDLAGNTYVADSGNHTIRKISAAGVSSTIAGLAGSPGSNDGTGNNARFNQPAGIALDSSTNVYVADFGNNTIRQITPAGLVTTIAGLPGIAGSSNGVGVAALFFQPMGLAADSANNLYVADYGNHLIRKITPLHSVSTLAGTAGVFGHTNGVGTAAVFYSPEAVAVDLAGNVYVADTGNAVIRKITAAGSVSTLAGQAGALGSADGPGGSALFFQPAGIAVNSATNLYVADYFNNTIRSVSAAGVVATVAGLAGDTGSADGTGSTARFWAPQGLAVNSADALYVADSGNGAIRVMTPGGVVSTLAGSASDGSVNGPQAKARFYAPQSVAIDAAGNIYIADAINSVIRQITAAGVVNTLAGTPGVFGSADGSGTNAQFSAPQGVAVDASGNVYVADTGNHTIRKIASGVVTTLAGAAGNFGNADGTGVNAQFWSPTGVSVDGSGRVYVADSGNHTIRRVSSGGVVTTLAGAAGTFGSADGATNNARFNGPVGIAVASSGNVFVTDYNNHTIRQLTPAGEVTTIAGWAGIWGSADGVNSAARFLSPAGIAVDGSGNLFVADTGNHTIRKMVASGTNWTVSTVVGLAGVSGSADGAISNVRFYHPASVAVNSAGYLFVADSGNNAIRTTEGVPVITWTNPPAIVYGTPLSGSQLNASASAPGTFAYTPASGTVLNAGVNPLLVAFTPSDTVNNRGVSASVSMQVVPATLTVTAANARRATGVPNPVFTGNIVGLVNGDSITATYSSAATPASPPGGYPIIPTLVDPGTRSGNYSVNLVNGILTVVTPPQVLSTSQATNKFTFTWSATANQKYQIESATNLSNPIWVNVGSPITATNSIATGSDTPLVPEKFYRIQLFP